MRILLTTDTIGGVWTFTRELCIGLLQQGHAVALVSFGRPPSNEQVAWCEAQTECYGREFYFESSDAPLEWMQSNERAYSGGEALLLRLVEKFGADVLHASQFCFGRLPVPIPRVITAHSDVQSWTEACRRERLPESAWLTRYCGLVQRGLDGADAVVAPTRWMLDAVSRYFEVAAMGHVIPNGRTLPFGASTAQPRAMQAVSVGRLWDEAKNLAVLTRIEPPFPVYVAGECAHEEFSGPTQFGGLTVLGLLRECELLDLFRRSSIYVVPSVYEPFGLAPLEAALCGCAVVANDLKSLREVWGDAAIYFRDAAELTAVLRRLQSSPKALHRAQTAARRRALEMSAARTVASYVDLYRSLCAPVVRVEEMVSDVC